MSVMTESRDVARLRHHSCTGKVPLPAKAARAISAQSHDEPTPIGPVEAYRCPFASEHPEPDLAWHVGHALSVETMEWMARVLRARSGNAPGRPESES